MKWRQKVNPDGTSRFVPADDAAVERDGGAAIHGDIQSFVSPIDGSVISDRKQLREHNKKHNVVNTSEFNPEFLERKKQERERFFKGEHTPAESLARKQELYEAFARADRNH